MEGPIRAKLRAERKHNSRAIPRPIARWDFRKGLKDQVGTLHGTLHGQARMVPGGLKVDGKTSYVATSPLPRSLKAKTLEAWVTLDNLGQRGGGVMSIQTPGGETFDAIVYGERDPGQWMAGSNGFVRTQSFQGPAEKGTHRQPIHIAIVYAADGTITGYRNGRPYGKPYQSPAVMHFQAGKAEILFGLRHSPAGGNHMLAGLIQRAGLYDRALTGAEVAASARSLSDFIAPAEIAARLPAPQRQAWQRLQARIQQEENLLATSTGKVYAVDPRPPEIGHVLIRGNPKQRGPVVSAGGFKALAGVRADFGLAADAPDAARRRRLAAWITHPNNPLFARVMVNRLWHYHFGTGLVDTPNDLGFNGGRPSHPELLDWLTAELVHRHWSLKELHRLIVTSAAYRQSSRFNETAARLDAGNRLLWRKSPRRMEAETVRDATLWVAGQLNLKMDGPSFHDLKPVRARGTGAILYEPVEGRGPEFNRRTLYRAWSRSGRNGLLDVFDCPDPSTTSPRRAVTTTPLQALVMLNSGHVLRMARLFAARLEREAPSEITRQVNRAYLLAYGRMPNETELVVARRVVQKHGLVVLARAIFNSNELLYID
jgi:hypothetical protein